MRREDVIKTYLMNSPKVVAEMLYDTITRYESKLKSTVEECHNRYTKCNNDCEVLFNENKSLEAKIQEIESKKTLDCKSRIHGEKSCEYITCASCNYGDMYEPK